VSRGILHVDMDAFYAAVEQRDHPPYRGRPVVVGADPRGGRGRGVVAACSYEARAFGIRSAMPISRAYRLCPHAIFLPVRIDRYAEVSAKIFEIFRRYTDLVEPCSIDEAFLDVTASIRLFGAPAAIAQRIKAAVKDQQGLAASVGVGPNKFIAKIASDLGKPDGFVVVEPADVEAFLRELSVTRLTGVGARTAAGLHGVGIRTIGELSRWPAEALARRFGAIGEHFSRLSRGLDDRPVIPETAPKSIGAETTFAVDSDDPRHMRRTLLHLAERVSGRLCAERRAGSTVTLKVRFADFTTLTRSSTVRPPVSFVEEIYAGVLSLLLKVPWKGRRIRLLGLAVSGFTAAPDQMPLFSPDLRREKAAGAVAEIRRRFGETGIVRASLLPAVPPEAGR
jgi:DNA polymerase IV